MTDTYRTLKGPCKGLFKVKGSKHWGYGFPITSEDEAKSILDDLRKEHHTARHVAFAWMLGFDGSHHRSSDDGEPNNSAGPPILGVIRANELTQVLFAVVRYFGGTKLGVGGLMEAYREATNEALKQGSIIECIQTQRLSIQFAYEHMGTIMSLVKRWNLEPAQTQFELSCSLQVDVRLTEVQPFMQAVLDTRVAEIECLT